MLGCTLLSKTVQNGPQDVDTNEAGRPRRKRKSDQHEKTLVCNNTSRSDTYDAGYEVMMVTDW